MCFRFTKTSGRGMPPGPLTASTQCSSSRRARHGPPRRADDSASCRLHDLGHVVVKPSDDLDYFRLALRPREFLRQIEQ